jgi:hypothetical protein
MFCIKLKNKNLFCEDKFFLTVLDLFFIYLTGFRSQSFENKGISNMLKKHAQSFYEEVGVSISKRTVSTSKGCCKKKGCFEFYNFGLCFLKEHDRYPFLFLRM